MPTASLWRVWCRMKAVMTPNQSPLSQLESSATKMPKFAVSWHRCHPSASLPLHVTLRPSKHNWPPYKHRLLTLLTPVVRWNWKLSQSFITKTWSWVCHFAPLASQMHDRLEKLIRLIRSKDDKKSKKWLARHLWTMLADLLTFQHRRWGQNRP